jgi:hypothetical protein
MLNRYEDWQYSILALTPVSSADESSQAVFEEAKTALAAALKGHSAKQALLAGCNSLPDLLELVEESKRKYEHRRGANKCRKWLSAVSSRLLHYSNVMDMLAQHHPEYVALAWGMLKFLVMVSCLFSQSFIGTFSSHATSGGGEP